MKPSRINPLLRPLVLTAALLTTYSATQAATYQWNGSTSNAWSTASNWQAAGSFNSQTLTAGPAPTGGTFAHRLNINNGPTGNEAVYTASQGTTTYANTATSGRGLVMGSGTLNSGTLRITGGTFSTLGSTAQDVIGNGAGNSGTLILDGGNFIGTNAGTGLGIGGGPTSVFTVNSSASSATVATLSLNATTATVNLNAGLLAANQVVGYAGTRNFNLNGGTLQARQNHTAFLDGMTAVNVLSNSIIDSNGFNVASNSPFAGTATLSKNGLGKLTLSGNSSGFTGPLVVNAGSLALTSSSSNGTIAFNGRISGNTGLEVNGPGTVSLGGASTYTGATNVLSGTLDLTGSLTSNIAVSSGAHLGGEGSTTGSLIFSGTSHVSYNPGTSGATGHLRAASIDASSATISFLPTGTLVGGEGIVIMEASGGINGSIGTNLLGNSRMALSFNGDNTRLLANYTPASMVWSGNDATHPTYWDTDTTANWINTGNSTTEAFVAGDNVTFSDDAASSSPVMVQIQSPVSPGAVTFSNNSKEFQISGAAISSGSLTFNGTSPVIVGSAVNGAGDISVSGGGNVTFSAGVSGTRNIALQGGGSVMFGGIISATGSLSMSGTGTVSLNAANTYSGVTNVSAGQVVLGNNAALGANTSGTTVSGTGSIDIKSFNLGTEVFTISGAGSGDGAIVNSGSVDQINALGRLVLAGDATIGGTRRWDLRNSTPTLDMGGYTLTKKGSNVISLVGVAISNPGSIDVAEGLFGVQTGMGLAGGEGHTLMVRTGATLENYQTSLPQTWTLRMEDSSTYWAESGNAAQNVWSGPVVIDTNGAVTFRASGFQYGSITGPISGVGASITKTDAGTIQLSGDSSYTGATTISGGSLVVKHANALGSPSTGTTVASGQVVVEGGVVVAQEDITINGGGSNFLGALQGSTGTNEWRGNVTIGSALTRIGVNSGEFTVSGVINSGSDAHGITFRPNATGSATLVLSGANTYLGDTSIISGTNVVKLSGGANRLPVQTNLIFGLAGVSGILDLNGQAQQVAGLAVNSGTANTITSADPATLTVNAATPSAFRGAITGKVSLTKSGAATLTLNGVNSYSGDTTVDVGGALIVAAAVPATTQTGGATLTGGSNVISVISTSGLAVGQAVTITNSTTEPVGTGAIPDNSFITSIVDGTTLTISNNIVTGGTPTSITFGALAAGRLAFQPGANGVSNRITGGGTATLAGSFDIDLNSAAIANGHEWVLVDVASATYDTVSFSVNGFTETTEGVWTKVDGNHTWTFSQSTGKLTLAVTSGYAQWEQENGVTGGAAGDDDQDGNINLVEYALGSNPKVVNPAPGNLNGNLLSFNKSATAVVAGDVAYSIETSPTLTEGSWTTVTPDTNNASTISYTLPASAPGGKIFARLKVVK